MSAPSHFGPRIALPMKPYQLQAISWMRQMEGRNLNDLFWEKRAFGDGGEYWFAPDLGECRLEEPPTASGGLLCDEMGGRPCGNHELSR